MTKHDKKTKKKKTKKKPKKKEKQFREIGNLRDELQESKQINEGLNKQLKVYQHMQRKSRQQMEHISGLQNDNEYLTTKCIYTLCVHYSTYNAQATHTHTTYSGATSNHTRNVSQTSQTAQKTF